MLVWQVDGTDDVGGPVASGIYICRLRSGKQVLSRKMLLGGEVRRET